MLDPLWKTVRDFQHKHMQVPKEEDPDLYHEVFRESDLRKVVATQHRIAQLAKDRGLRTLPSILIILDDVADDPKITRESATLTGLYLRGRHAGISTILSTQVYKVSPQIRRNITCAMYWKPRNLSDWRAIVDENSKLAGSREDMEAIFEEATREKHSFLYIDYTAEPGHYFWANFTDQLRVSSG